MSDLMHMYAKSDVLFHYELRIYFHIHLVPSQLICVFKPPSASLDFFP